MEHEKPLAVPPGPSPVRASLIAVCFGACVGIGLAAAGGAVVLAVAPVALDLGFMRSRPFEWVPDGLFWAVVLGMYAGGWLAAAVALGGSSPGGGRTRALRVLIQAGRVPGARPTRWLAGLHGSLAGLLGTSALLVIARVAMAQGVHRLPLASEQSQMWMLLYGMGAAALGGTPSTRPEPGQSVSLHAVSAQIRRLEVPPAAAPLGPEALARIEDLEKAWSALASVLSMRSAGLIRILIGRHWVRPEEVLARVAGVRAAMHAAAGLPLPFDRMEQAVAAVERRVGPAAPHWRGRVCIPYLGTVAPLVSAFEEVHRLHIHSLPDPERRWVLSSLHRPIEVSRTTEFIVIPLVLGAVAGSLWLGCRMLDGPAGLLIALPLCIVVSILILAADMALETPSRRRALAASVLAGHGMQGAWARDRKALAFCVESVDPDSPAGWSGIRPGDRVVAWRGAPLDRIGRLEPEAPMEITVLRSGETVAVALRAPRAG